MRLNRKEAIAILKAADPTLQQARIDAADDRSLYQEATQAMRAMLTEYPQLTHRIDSLEDAVLESAPSNLPIPDAGSKRTQLAIAHSHRLNRVYGQRMDAVTTHAVYITAEVPLQTAITLAQLDLGGAQLRTRSRAETLHITLAYLGAHSLPGLEPRLERLTQEIAAGVANVAPLQGGFTGSGRMVGKMGEGDAFYVSPHLKGLVALRQLVKKRCEFAGFPIQSEYDFIPHITLGYLEPESLTPHLALPSDLPLTLDSLSIGVNYKTFQKVPLSGTARLDQVMDSAPTTQTLYVNFRQNILPMTSSERVSYASMGQMQTAYVGSIRQDGDCFKCMVGGATSTDPPLAILESHGDGSVKSRCLMFGFSSPAEAKAAYISGFGAHNFGVILPEVMSYIPRQDARMPRRRKKSIEAARDDEESHPAVDPHFPDLPPLLSYDHISQSEPLVIAQHNIHSRFQPCQNPALTAEQWIDQSRLPQFNRELGVDGLLRETAVNILCAWRANQFRPNVFSADMLSFYGASVAQSHTALRQIQADLNQFDLPPNQAIAALKQSMDLAASLAQSAILDKKTRLQQLAIAQGRMARTLVLANYHQQANALVERLRGLLSPLPANTRQLTRQTQEQLKDARAVRSQFPVIDHLAQSLATLRHQAARLYLEKLAFDQVPKQNLFPPLSGLGAVLLDHVALAEDLKVQLEDDPQPVISFDQMLVGQNAASFDLLDAIQQQISVDPTSDIAPSEQRLAQTQATLDTYLANMIELIDREVSPTPIAALPIETEHQALYDAIADLHESVQAFDSALAAVSPFNVDYGDHADLIADSFAATQAELEGYRSFCLMATHDPRLDLDALSQPAESVVPHEADYLAHWEQISPHPTLHRSDADPQSEWDAADWIYDHHKTRYSNLVKGWLTEISNFIQAKPDLQSARDNIQQMFAALDTDQFERQLAQDMAIARMAGAYEMLDESNVRMDAPYPPWVKMPFNEAVDFFKAKEILPTFTTQAIPDDYHNWAFMISGVTRADILSSTKWLLEQALERGTTEETFHRQFNRLVGRKGWRPNSHRVQLIFVTNMRSAYSDGRYRQTFEGDLPDSTVLVWRHGDSRSPRPRHLALNNKAIPIHHPFWKKAYPICGYGCKCRAFALLKSIALNKGYEILNNPPNPDLIADPQWRSNPSQYFDQNARADLVKRSKSRLDPELRKIMASYSSSSPS